MAMRHAIKLDGSHTTYCGLQTSKVVRAAAIGEKVTCKTCLSIKSRKAKPADSYQAKLDRKAKTEAAFTEVKLRIVDGEYHARWAKQPKLPMGYDLVGISIQPGTADRLLRLRTANIMARLAIRELEPMTLGQYFTFVPTPGLEGEDKSQAVAKVVIEMVTDGELEVTGYSAGAEIYSVRRASKGSA